ncbi:hypothetical protein [Nocardia sp. IFM 10818]
MSEERPADRRQERPRGSARPSSAGRAATGLRVATEQPERTEFQRLIYALTIGVGWEAQIALRDVRGLDPQSEAEVVRWAARVLVEAAIRESGAKTVRDSGI